MTATAMVLAVSMAKRDTPCRRCGDVIQRGRRIAVVTGTGNVHLRCLIGHQDAATAAAPIQASAPAPSAASSPATGDSASNRKAAQP